MMHKLGIFDNKKQQGKTVDVFTTKKAQIDLSSTDRSTSPFRGYKPAAGSNMPRTQELGVSRGIFQNKKDSKDESFIQSGRMSATTEPDRGVHNNYAQVFQDFLNSELRSQIAQFRTEMLQAMNESLKDFNDRSNKNQETIVAIKDTIKNHSHNIEKLDHKIEEYHTNLDTISGMFQSEIEKLKHNPPSRSFKSQDSKQLEENLKAYNEDKLNQIQDQQEEIAINFERLKEELTESVRLTLEEYSRASEDENNYRAQKISNEVTGNMDQKITKVTDHLDSKVALIEKQIADIKEPDNFMTDKIKFQIDDRINEHAQGLRQQLIVLNEKIQEKADESALKEPVADPELKNKIDNLRYELEVIKSELGVASDQVKGEVGSLNKKVDAFEVKFSEELRQARNNRSASTNEQSTSLKSNQAGYDNKILNLELQFDELRQTQKDLNSDISIQKAQLESFKTTSAIAMNDIRSSHSTLQDGRLRKLEQVVDQLSKNAETLKLNSQVNESTNPTKFSETGSYNERVIPKVEALSSYGYPHSNPFADSYSRDIKTNEFSVKSEISTKTRPVLEPTSYSPTALPPIESSAALVDKTSAEAKQSFGIGQSRTQVDSRKDILNQVSFPAREVTSITPEAKSQNDAFSKSYLPGVGAAARSTEPETMFEDNYSLNRNFTQNMGTWNTSKPQAGLTTTKGAETQATTTYAKNPKDDFNVTLEDTNQPQHLRNNPVRQQGSIEAQVQEGKEDEDEVEVVYQIDENGYLMDEYGNYILDDKGEMIKLNDEQIERLRENNLLEEDEEN